MSVGLSMVLVLVFVLIGGVFSATEMALVSLRESQIKRLERSPGAGRTVAGLARNSGLFLSAVQIGVTFAGFFSSAFGASTIAPQVSPVFVSWGMSQATADLVALVVLTIIVSYLSLVLGELVPKRIAMQKAERISLLVAKPLNVFVKLMRPVIWITNGTSNLLLRALGFDPNARTESMSSEEVREIVTTFDGFEEEERELVGDVFDANDRLVGEIMRHRSDVVAFDASETVATVTEAIRHHPYSRYPVFEGTIDSVIGFIHVRDLLDFAAQGRNEESVKAILRPIAQFPGTLKLPVAMRQMRASGHHIAVVIDEYGGTDGLVTLEDLLEELVGEIWDEYDRAEHQAVLALHESKQVDGATNLEDFAESTGIHLPEGPYETVAGWIVTELSRLGREGDVIPVPPEYTIDREDDDRSVRYELEIIKVRGNRIVSVSLRKAKVPGADNQE
ncbi:hemolysin family protein [Corynebacterium pacaense]|uniref:hemolysin family protein n=1 Tax=Corynebacterium pacaense TaxID=1816684 RepID=UPI0009BACA38|nr:hemolysin family protein [Corynebacterium pacaense]